MGRYPRCWHVQDFACRPPYTSRASDADFLTTPNPLYKRDSLSAQCKGLHSGKLPPPNPKSHLGDQFACPRIQRLTHLPASPPRRSHNHQKAAPRPSFATKTVSMLSGITPASRSRLNAVIRNKRYGLQLGTDNVARIPSPPSYCVPSLQKPQRLRRQIAHESFRYRLMAPNLPPQKMVSIRMTWTCKPTKALLSKSAIFFHASAFTKRQRDGILSLVRIPHEPRCHHRQWTKRRPFVHRVCIPI